MSAQKIEPDKKLRDRIRKESKEIAGFELYDVRWDTGRDVYVDGERLHVMGHDCLCIMEQHVVTKTWTARKPLRHPATDPEAKKTCETEQPDGSRVVCDVPLEEGDDGYLEKVVGLPRQIREFDVAESLDSARNAVRRSREVAEKLQKQKDDQAAAQASLREDYVSEASKELAKLFWQEKTGKNAFVDLGHRSEAGTSRSDRPEIIDRRRIK